MGYCLNYEHQKGKHKALLFEKRLGITIANKEILEQSLKEAAIEGEAKPELDRSAVQHKVKKIPPFI
jgi:hypothetical protein